MKRKKKLSIDLFVNLAVSKILNDGTNDAIFHELSCVAEHLEYHNYSDEEKEKYMSLFHMYNLSELRTIRAHINRRLTDYMRKNLNVGYLPMFRAAMAITCLYPCRELSGSTAKAKFVIDYVDLYHKASCDLKSRLKMIALLDK